MGKKEDKSMKIGIMQPYFMPYIGYWQLINSVDKFVLLDDVNYIKRGYINRNTIRLNGGIYRFTIPIYKASQNRLIKDTKLNFDVEAKEKLLMTLHNAYKKSKYYVEVMPVLEKIINNPSEELTTYIKYSIEQISAFLKIDTPIILSSKIQKNNDLTGQERIIEICKRMHATMYINPSGGRKLYSQELFESNNLQLRFLDCNIENVHYDKLTENLNQPLSIIDVLMNNEVKKVQYFLREFTLNEK